MRIIELDAANWKTVNDFYTALLVSIGAPAWHGRNLNALVDSMIWGGVNALQPPFTVRISGIEQLPRDIRHEVELTKRALTEARAEFCERRSHDAEVLMETVS